MQQNPPIENVRRTGTFVQYKWCGMDSEDLTTKQAERMRTALFRLNNYLSRLVNRMERTGFPPTDPLYQRTKAAYDAVCSLCMDLHYRSCRSGVARSRNKREEQR